MNDFVVFAHFATVALELRHLGSQLRKQVLLFNVVVACEEASEVQASLDELLVGHAAGLLARSSG